MSGKLRGRGLVQKGIRTALAALAMLATAGAGCGSDSSNASLTKAEFVKQGNVICKKGYEKKNTELAATFEKETKKDSGQLSLSPSQEEDLVLDVALPPVQAVADGLNELGPPAGDEKEVSAIVEQLEAAIVEIGEDPLNILQGTENPFDKYTKLASEYGLRECAKI
jgi:hypothetical protein